MNEVSQYHWDLPTRITHWAIALCVVLDLFFFEGGDDGHTYAGYLAAALVVFRFAWGFVATIPPRHNVLAKLVYLAIWSVILALAVTGFMLDLDRFWGEAWLQDLHSYLSTALQFLVVSHLLGVTIDSVRFRRKTWAAMFTGRRY